MWAISPLTQEGLGQHAGGWVEGELQHHTQVVGQFIEAEEQAGLLVGLHRVDHGALRSRESPWTCSNRCSEVARPRSKVST